MIILIPVFWFNLTLSHTQLVKEVKVYGVKRKMPRRVLVAQSGSMTNEKNNREAVSEAGQSEDRAVKQKNSKADSKRTPSETDEKKAPLKEFVPSEKIEADKAVDFPADI